MDFLYWLIIVCLIIGYLNLALILFREKPTINIYNKLPEDFKSGTYPADKNAIIKDYSSTAEIPIESTVTVKNLNGEINLDSEKVGSSNVSSLTEKIKKVRSKK